MSEKDGVQDLRVILTDADINEMARKSAKLSAEVRKLTDERKQAGKHFAAEIERRQIDMDVISRAIENGWMERPVDVRTMFDVPREGWKTTVRLDTGEEVECGPMSVEERQYQFDMGKAERVQ